jgi:succinate dehydrogenase / fumarate reductase, flavoprotein subunit
MSARGAPGRLRDVATDEPRTLAVPVLVIGAGAAGLRVAIELTGRGVACLVVGKRRHGDAHTRMAAGGINAALGSLDPEDRWDIHAADTIREGGFLSQPRAVELLARESPARVEELAAWGCPFDRTQDGRINQRYFGAQSFRRTCFVGDTTGQAILDTLVARAGELDVPYRENVFITRLVTHAGVVVGAMGLDLDAGEALYVRASVTVLAAGGCTSLYARGSSREDENTGDAMALAFQAGATLRDMEMIQFHPTGMVEPADMRGRLVTEAVRGEGGRLFNARGERFMERYAPEQMELAARDVVARANYDEIRAGRGTPADAVLLDISHEPADRVRDRLPRIYHQLLDQGVDITREPVQVAPTAHYPMGGVLVDPDTGASTVPGLFAVGEAASGVHGANRLGGNSLADTLVFGQRTGAFIHAQLDRRAGSEPPPRSDGAIRHHAAMLRGLLAGRGQADPADAMDRIRQLMWSRAGIIRSGQGLRDGLQELDTLAAGASGADGASSSLDGLVRALTLPFALLTARAILRSALLRDESRGAHFREDTPAERDDWLRNILCAPETDGGMRLRTEPVPPVPAAIQRALDQRHTLHYHHLE